MLKLMREKAGSWFIKVILGAIVVVFVFWGVGNFRSGRLEKVAVVNETPITVEAYNQSYNALIERYRSQFGAQFNEDMIRMFGLKRQALDQLINQILMLQEAEKLNFRVTDDELAAVIQAIPAFQNNGAFDNRIYTRVLNMNRLTPEAFEKDQREAIRIDKLRRFITDNVKVSDQEALDWYLWENAAVNIAYVVFEPDRYQDIDVTDEAVRQYFDAHQSNYKTEPKIKAQYIYFDPQKFMDGVTVTDDDVKAYFEEHPDEFAVQKTVKARHILFRLENDSSPEEVATQRKKAETVLALAREGQDFGELAKTYSEDPGKDRGGDLGTFTRETMVKPFADQAFSMKAGEISDPVRTQFGWHIIKVEAVNEAYQKTLDEVDEEIIQKITEERAKATAYEHAESIYDAAYDGDDLKTAAEGKAGDVKETDWFTLTKGPAGVNDPTRFARTAFELSDMQISDIQEYGDGYYLIQTLKRTPEAVAPFDDVRERVKADLLENRRSEKALADAQIFLAALREGAVITEEAAKMELSVKETGFFKRNETIPEIGRSMEITTAAFELSKNAPLPEAPIEGPSGRYVIKFVDRRTPDPDAFEPEKTTVKAKLRQQKQMRVFGDWLAQVRKNSDITVNSEMVE
ncbi:SurA N-terminal domain-containing protein [Desulfococcus multivorans]|uniref:Periplasmic chaperone PpiD n=1 Tax=Desulfococcus multivorans DSM 2059 TaxID=1121405 RepID=S7TWZ3_DESML|nr:SurA N-terminal domain-containing protein [Desulfococcus multivorans]AOY58168.1 PpiD: peptidyl-prolyl cis-trans isomerase D [Desulfococcus multivorans]AQV00520.1 hypothetical protein B2D07_06870 [Desulfococcus multivorans]EPR41265.1 PpiC-type peptidyl-prolyl cis-trans isomerase [Desulfococcus multivorans DSM 2059]SJZ74407.1 peptidyl-prolyl cis-trans isomerase D [Desulfococcus multivorans DSM 2059]